jgi:hypothetical protein
MREVKINKCMNGFIVNVGCQTLVFQSADSLVAELATYLKSPRETEEAYTAKFEMVTSGVNPVAVRERDQCATEAIPTPAVPLGYAGGQNDPNQQIRGRY